MSASKKAAAQAVATTDLNNIDFSADIGAGMEGAGSEAFAIPFLRALQTNSPEVDEASSKYIPDAKPGMLLNTVTGDLFDGKEGAPFVPCAYQRRFLRWAPRGASTQGFRGEMLPEEVAQLRAENRLVEHEGRVYFPLEDGKVDEKRCDRVTDTRSHFGLVLKDGVPHQVLLSLSSTQIKKSKLLMSLLNQQTVEHNGKRVVAPTFLNVVRITTLKESNDRGSWFGVHFALDGRVPNAAVYEAGRAFHASINAGAVKVDYAAAGDEAAGEQPGHDPDKF